MYRYHHERLDHSSPWNGSYTVLPPVSGTAVCVRCWGQSRWANSLLLLSSRLLELPFLYDMILWSCFFGRSKWDNSMFLLSIGVLRKSRKWFVFFFRFSRGYRWCHVIVSINTKTPAYDRSSGQARKWHGYIHIFNVMPLPP